MTKILDKEAKKSADYAEDKFILLELGLDLLPLADRDCQFTIANAIKELRKTNPDFPIVELRDNCKLEKKSFRVNNGKIHLIDFDETSNREVVINKIIEILQEDVKSA